MADQPLPLHALLQALARWGRRPGPQALAAMREAIEATTGAYGATGARLELDAPPLARLELAVGDLSRGAPSAGGPASAAVRTAIRPSGRSATLGALWVTGPPTAARLTRSAIGAAVESAWGVAEAHATTVRLQALDEATRAIAAELGLERVLQLIVDRARPLVGARYAAIGIFAADGRIERFLTSGIPASDRRRIGHPPAGRGILGRIIREGKAFRVRDVGEHPDAWGFPAGHPRMSSFLGVPVLVGGQPVGNLYLAEKERADSFSEGDQQVVESFALHAGIAIQNARLHAQVQGLAVMEDRERIGKDLHDGIIQELYAVGLSLEDVPELLGDDPDEAGRRVERAIDRLHFTIRDIRNFIFELQPDLLEAPTLVAGASQLVEEFRHNTAVEAELDVHDVAAEPPSAIVREILAILSEALSNVARHAHAHLATVEIAGGDDHLSLTITDDGIGLPDGGAGLLGHQGLRNMRSRADRLGASLELGAGPEGGTRVILRVGGEGRLS